MPRFLLLASAAAVVAAPVLAQAPAADTAAISGTRRPQHRLGHHVRAYRRGRRPPGEGRQGHPAGRLGIGRRVEVRGRRDDVQAGLRQAAGQVDRRGRARSDQPSGDVGRHRRKLDPQFGLGRQRRLQIGRWRRDLDPRRPAQQRTHRPDRRPPQERQHRLCLRARAFVVGLARSRPLQDHRRRQQLVADPERREPVDGLLVGGDGPGQPRASARRDVGFPPQAL